MNATERRATFSLAGIYGLRMFGLFAILPVFALYAEGLRGVTPLTVGLALGAYGLTMAILQIPFGMLSDRLGRKPIITAGLVLFASGSAVAAMADSIWGVIIGRALQGAGAIAAAMMALLADLTSEEQRTKAMAILGIAIGMSFTLALIVGPFLDNVIGVPGIFWLTAVMAILAIGLLYLGVPDPVQSHVHRDVETVPGQLKGILADRQLLRLDFGILVQHGIMMAMFTALPFVLRDQLGFPSQQHAWFYLPVLLLSVLGMVPLIILAEKRRKMKQVFVGCVALMLVSELMLAVLHGSMLSVALGLLLFFIAYNVLEASLPSLISRMAPADGKGTAMGVYSTSQFLGAFLGGAAGGWLYGQWGVEGSFFGCALAAGVWILAALGMRMPAYLSSHLLHVQIATEAEAIRLKEQLLAVAGVHEASVVPEEGVAYLKVDKSRLDEQALQALVGQAQPE